MEHKKAGLYIIFIVSTALLTGGLLLVPSSVGGQGAQEDQCEGQYKGRNLASDELAKVLEDHRAWLTAEGKDDDDRRANLCGADLRGANLGEVNLSKANLMRASLEEANLLRANLSKAFLRKADLRGVHLVRADLSEAQLSKANLHGADLSGVNLRGALLIGTNLSKTSLVQANLSGAFLNEANLSEAYLVDADLSEAHLSKANLAYTVFDLQSASLPNIPSLAGAQNLWQMTFILSPRALVEVREAFKKAGLRAPEREVTFAINRRNRELGNKIESVFTYLMFELTCQYGMVPGRPLRILGWSILLFSIPYMITLKIPGRAGIWMIWLPDRVHKDEGQEEPVRVAAEWSCSRWAGTRWALLICWPRVFGIALYFSLLSAFQIGWRDLNVGTWLSRVQSREYTLRATGWVRTVSGVQSLFSVYLLALWVLTYFGRPFE